MSEQLDLFGGNDSHNIYSVIEPALIEVLDKNKFEARTNFLRSKRKNIIFIDQGYTEINSPKAVMKQAYADGIITDESTWLALLTDRNITSHIYDDATAAGVFNRIDSQYISLFTALLTTLSK